MGEVNDLANGEFPLFWIAFDLWHPRTIDSCLLTQAIHIQLAGYGCLYGWLCVEEREGGRVLIVATLTIGCSC